MKKRKEQEKNNSIRLWLSRIFTHTRVIMALTIISVVAAIVGTYYGVKSYKATRPAQICLKYYDSLGGPTCVDEKEVFVNLRTFGSKSINYYNRTELNQPNYNGFPTIENATGKSIKDLRIYVIITCGDLILEQRNICPEFEIIERNRNKNTIKLRYKSNILPAHSFVPFPFYALLLPDDKDHFDPDHYVLTCYEISYDGIDHTRDFAVIDYFALGDQGENEYQLINISRERLDTFLTHCYDCGFFTVQKRRALVSIIRSNVQKVIPPRNLSDENFEQFKLSYIQ